MCKGGYIHTVKKKILTPRKNITIVKRKRIYYNFHNVHVFTCRYEAEVQQKKKLCNIFSLQVKYDEPSNLMCTKLVWVRPVFISFSAPQESRQKCNL